MNLRTLTPLGWAACAALAALLLALAAYVATSPARAHKSALAARAEATFSGARTEAAIDANRLGGEARAAAGQSESLTQETTHVLQATPGADQRLDPALNRAGRERLCLRAAYREGPECRLFQPGR